MVRLATALLLTCATLSLEACGKPQGAQTNDAITVENGAVGKAAPAGPAPEEVKGQEFVSSVLGGYDFAIAGARQLSDKAQTAEGKAFGQKMATDFSASLDGLKRIAAGGGLKLDPVAGPTDQTDMAVLSSATGLSLEKAFAAQQLDRLSQLLGLVRAYKNGGDNPELRAWAEQAQTVVNDKLLGVQSLKAELDEAADKD